MKTVSQCREKARRVYYGAVFEIKKGIPDYTENMHPEQPMQETTSEPRESSEEAAPREEKAPVPTRSNYCVTAPPVPEYVFVKRDGSMFYAVAYSWMKDKLQYVTKEGLRRVASLDSLDLDATQKYTEERGNALSLAAPVPSNMARAVPFPALRESRALFPELCFSFAVHSAVTHGRRGDRPRSVPATSFVRLHSVLTLVRRLPNSSISIFVGGLRRGGPLRGFAIPLRHYGKWVFSGS